MNKNLLVILAVVVVVGLWLMGEYNGLVTQNEAVINQWAQVETQYQRRFDLIPNLIESTKGIFEQEQEVFGKIAEARTRYSGAQGVDEKVAAAGEMESALGKLLVVVENYPQLASNETVLGLMDELAGTENRVSVERKRYNDTARIYNTSVKTFPQMILANLFGFDEHTYFEAAEGAEEAPRVDLTTE